MPTAKFVYPRLSGDKILWHLANGEVSAASTLATKLITWQATASGTTAEQRRRGGWPSVLAQDPLNPGTWIAAGAADGSGIPRWYSHDTLVILTALVELQARNPQAAYLNAAIAAGDFIKNMVALPIGAGYLDATNFAPVHFVDPSGAWDVDIYGSDAYAYIGGMDKLATLTSDSSYTTCANNARTFYARGQHAQGWWWDHYITFSNYPTFPPAAYTDANWTKYSVDNNQIIADNFLLSSIGAAKAGDSAAATAAYNWIAAVVDNNGGVPAYLAPGASGADGFNGGSVYHDIVSSGLWRSLCQWQNQSAKAHIAVAYCEAAEDADGGFTWGRFRIQGLDATGSPSAQAPYTGMWCSADMSVFGTALAPPIAYSSLFPRKRLASIAVTPGGTNIATTTQQFTATATYDDATTADVTASVFWSSDTPGIMTVDQTGLGTKVSGGAFNMYATIGRINGHAFNVVD